MPPAASWAVFPAVYKSSGAAISSAGGGVEIRILPDCWGSPEATRLLAVPATALNQGCNPPKHKVYTSEKCKSRNLPYDLP